MTPAEQQFRAELISLLPRLRRFGRAITGHREDADDLVQMTIERALTRRDQWEAGTRLASWLFRIMQNAWIDELRVRTRRDRIFAPEEAGEHVGVATTEDQINALSMRKAMERLNEEQRVAVSLVLVEGLPYKEAAAVLGIPIGTLTSRLARAREQLQGMLAEPGRAAGLEVAG